MIHTLLLVYKHQVNIKAEPQKSSSWRRRRPHLSATGWQLFSLPVLVRRRNVGERVGSHFALIWSERSQPQPSLRFADGEILDGVEYFCSMLSMEIYFFLSEHIDGCLVFRY